METVTPTSRSSGPTERVAWLIFAAYCGLHVLARCTMPHAVEFDEGEQMLYAAALKIAYGQDQPLYSWLQWCAFQIFGVSVLALSVVKQGILFAFYAGVHTAALRLGGDRRTAFASVASLSLLPTIGFLAQRDLTHTVLATALAAWTLVAWIGVVRRPEWGRFLVLGLLLGLGGLAKLLYLLLPASLLLSSLFHPRWRSPLRDPRMLVALLVAAGVLTPHLLALGADSGSQAAIHRKLAPEHGGRIQGVLFGAWELFRSIFEYAGPLLALVGAVAAGRGVWCRFRWKALGQEPRFLLRAVACGFGVLALAVLLGVLTDFKARWFQTIFWALAPGAALAVGALLPEVRVRWFSRIAIAAAVLCLGGIAIRPVLASWFDVRVRPASSYDRVANSIAEAYPGKRVVVASDFGIGGSWRLHRPAEPVIVPDYPEPLPQVPGAKVLLLWDASKKPELPEKLRRRVEVLTGADAASLTSRYFEAPYNAGGREVLRLGVIALPLQ